MNIVVFAQDYPNKPLRISAGPAGGGGDFVARQIAQGISGPLSQPVIVENRVTILGAELVSKAPPDGYALQVAGAVLWIFPLLQKTPYHETEYRRMTKEGLDAKFFHLLGLRGEAAKAKELAGILKRLDTLSNEADLMVQLELPETTID